MTKEITQKELSEIIDGLEDLYETAHYADSYFMDGSNFSAIDKSVELLKELRENGELKCLDPKKSLK